MVLTEIIETKRGAGMGICIQLHNARLLLIRAEKGYVACSYFDKKTIEKMNDCAVIINGVKNFKEMLQKKVSYVSKKAKKLGIRETMTGEQALDRMI